MCVTFKKRKGIHIPYRKQGLIYFICVNVRDMPEDVQQKIVNLCIEVGGKDYQALYKFLTDDTGNVHSVALEFHISEIQLYRYRKMFYERW